jgi:hypothetical protein
MRPLGTRKYFEDVVTSKFRALVFYGCTNLGRMITLLEVCKIDDPAAITKLLKFTT